MGAKLASIFTLPPRFSALPISQIPAVHIFYGTVALVCGDWDAVGTLCPDRQESAPCFTPHFG